MISGDIIADVGSDHAYLPIWLYLNKKIKKAYALDISEKCLDTARRNLKKYNISEEIITPVLSDGLSGLSDPAEPTDIIIAGMGAMNIAEILSNAGEKLKIPGAEYNFILQPNNKPEFLRDFLNENRFYTVRDIKIKSRSRVYNIINANLYT